MNEYGDTVGPFEMLTETMAEGGPVMWPIAALTCLLPLTGLVLLIVTVVNKKRALGFGAAMLIGATASIALAAVGQALAMGTAEQAIKEANPEDRQTIRIAAKGEAMAAMSWALSGAVVPAFLGCLLVGLGLSRLDRFKAP